MTPRSPTSRDTATSREIRIERDLLGELAVPADAYYGIHTARSIANFPISGIEVGALTELVVSLAAIKAAAATTNNELGRLDDSRTAAIVGACREIQAGRLHDQFRVDVMQGGAGTSTNMLVNEVVANRGLELLGRPRGDYVFLHPLDHVNLGQSTNDVYPTALRLALYGLLGQLATAVAKLRSAIGERAVAFAGLPKLGRTELQDAVPMTLGREFGSWATTLREEEQRLEEVALLLCEVNLGGTAIGTSVNAHPAYRHWSVSDWPRTRGFPSYRPKISSRPPGTPGYSSPSLVRRSGRLLRSPGSATTCASSAPARRRGSARSTFQPVIAATLFRSLRQLARGCDLLAERCICGVSAHPAVLRRHLDSDTSLLTALAGRIGHAAAVELSSQAARSDSSVRELVVSRGLASQAELDEAIDEMVEPPNEGDPRS